MIPNNLTEVTKIQARVLQALSQEPGCIFSRAELCKKSGFTAKGGSLARALNGVKPTNRWVTPHPGLIVLGYVLKSELDVEGVTEAGYQITNLGLSALNYYVYKHGELGEIKDKDTATNKRYQID